MIVTKTPLRISFFGGGSDIPEFYNNNPGLVLSTTINKHIYIASNFCVVNHIKLVYSEMEYPKAVNDIKHDRIREVFKYLGINNNIEIASFSDVPTKGTGLGSSSTFTVGILHAIAKQLGLSFNKRDLAELACYIEIDCCKEPIGKQDQYAAAYGGFNMIRFNKDTVTVTPLPVTIDNLNKLEYNLFIYNTGINRQASTILASQVENLKSNNDTVECTRKIVEMAELSIKHLLNKEQDEFGKLLDSSWNIKKKLSSGISNINIDRMYETAMSAGALGGKLLGAGGGGYMLFYVPENNHHSFAKKMIEFERFPFKFTEHGSTLEMYNDNRD
jgi:D-glycero-alpha-D-manno-heptose-7-phosphate kinase